MKQPTPFVTPDYKNQVVWDFPPKPTKSPYPRRHYFVRRYCRHVWELLYTEPVYFFQEHLGDHYHYACPKCGETEVVDKG